MSKNSPVEFLVFDDIDYMLMLRLRKKSEDFSKLDEVDQKVLVWSLTYQPRRIQSWVDYLTNEYMMKRSIGINKVSLMEMIKELTRITIYDQEKSGGPDF